MQGQHKILDRTWTTLALSRVLPCVELRSIHFLSQACCASHPGRLPYRRHSRSESTSKRVFRIVAYDDGTLWHKRRHLLESLLLELLPFPFIFPFTALGVLKQLPRCNTSLQLDPPQRTDCLERLVIQVPLKRRESIKLNFQNNSPSHCLLHGNVLDRYWTTAATSPLSVAEGSFLAFILVSGCSRLWNNQN